MRIENFILSIIRKIEEIKPGIIAYAYKDGNETKISCDSVISSAGYIPAPLEAKGKVHLVGDCFKVGNLRSVIWRAFETAAKI